MKTVFSTRIFLISYVALLVNSCVPASQTIADLKWQSNYKERELQTENSKTRQLIQDKSQLEAKLSGLKAKRKSLDMSDPVGNRNEIGSLNREIAKLESHLKSMQ